MYRVLVFLLVAACVNPQDISDDLKNIVDSIYPPPSKTSHDEEGTIDSLVNTDLVKQAINNIFNISNPSIKKSFHDEEGTVGSVVKTNPVNEAVPTVSENPFTTITLPTHVKDTSKSCITVNYQMGQCVPLYRCSTTHGKGIINIRAGGVCQSYMDVCCQLVDIMSEILSLPTENPDLPKREGCGWANPNGVGMKTTGESDGETKFGEFPWMVAIIKLDPASSDPYDQPLNIFFGGGSLIHPSAVLTGAHCVANKPELRVRAGDWDTQTIDEIYPYQDREVESVVLHKDYNKDILFYDIAIVFLKSPMDLNFPNVALACLPPAKHIVWENTRCFATGWGKDKYGKEGIYKVILKKVELPVVNHNTCKNNLRTTALGPYFELHKSFMCAGGKPGKDTCKGDGGSPLVCPHEYDKDRYVQNGIVAWGIGCGENGIPGVYVDVAYLRDWIDDKITGKGYSQDVYTAY